MKIRARTGALRVGLIGCGSIAQLVHLNILTRLPQVALVALAEPDPQRRAAASQRMPQAAVFVDHQELLESPEIEAVVICLPNALHAEVAVAALQHGKHVYLEKPLATNLDEGRNVLSAWRCAGVVGMIGFNLRLHALFQEAKQYLHSGRLGTLVGVRSTRSTAPQSLPPWKLARRSGGGVLLDLASHHLDLVHFLFEQSVREVYAELRSQRSEDDSAMLHLRFADGLFVQSFFSMNAVEEDRFEVYGQAGKLAVDRYHSLKVEVTDPTQDFSWSGKMKRELWLLVRSPALWGKLLAPQREPSYQVALARFVEAVRTNRPASPDFWDGYRSMVVIAAAEESARTGRAVMLPDLVNEDFVG
jgi:myo-inositol 2-dehydrogenase / D-chiro-inositol 1-dehydrogenase